MGNRKAKRPPKRKRVRSNEFFRKPTATTGNWDYPGIENIEQLLDYLGHDKKRIKNFMGLSVYQMNLDRRPWLKELQNYV